MANQLQDYIKTSIEEMKKVAWPTKKETYNFTILVITISLGMAMFLGLLDYIFNLGYQALLNQI